MLKPTDAVRQLFTTAQYYLEMYLHTAENGAIGAFSDLRIRDETIVAFEKHKIDTR